MSTARTEKAPLTRVQVLRVVREYLLSPSLLLCIAFTCLSRFIHAGLIVGYLKSFLAIPSGAVAIAALLLCCVTVVGGVALFIRQLALIRRLRTSGNVPHLNHWYFAAFYLSIQLAIAPTVALVIWHGIQAPEGRLVGGKVTLLSPKQRLKTTIRTLERDGTWTWFVKGQR